MTNNPIIALVKNLMVEFGLSRKEMASHIRVGYQALDKSLKGINQPSLRLVAGLFLAFPEKKDEIIAVVLKSFGYRLYSYVRQIATTQKEKAMTATLQPTASTMLIQQLLNLARDRNTPTATLYTIYQQVAVDDDDTTTLIRRTCICRPHAYTGALGAIYLLLNPFSLLLPRPTSGRVAFGEGYSAVGRA